MIYIIRKILSEISFSAKVGFEFTYTVGEHNEEKNIEVSSFVSNKSKDICILCCTLNEGDFLEIDDKELIVNIASNFRSNCEWYIPEMDKNTSLILCNKRHENATLSVDRQRRIEDDPFYFKKYVLLYSEKELAELKKHLEQQHSVVDSIKEYIYNKQNFDKYKDNPENNYVYSAIISLITKIPVIPMNFTKTKDFYDIKAEFTGKLIESKSITDSKKIESIIRYVDTIDEKEVTDFNKVLKFAEDIYNNFHEGERI